MNEARRLQTVPAIVVFVLCALGGAREARGQGATSDRATTVPSDAAARIARVERGLLPAVAIRGVRDTAYTLADRLERYSVPGVSIAVIDQGRVAWTRAYGALEAGGAQRVDTTTIFQAGSISKAITAVAALRHVERGQLALDEDVNRRLTSWKVPASPAKGERLVTLRELLSHSAGFNVPSFPGYAVGESVPTLQQVLLGTPPSNTPPVSVETEPGRQWSYSGGGITVVQQLLMDVSHQPFADVLREAVLVPAGMSATVAEQPLPAARARTAARGHSSGATIPGGWRVYPELAAAGLWSTSVDLARFGIAVMRSIRGDSRALLRPELARDMAQRQIGDWGLGFALAGTGDSATVGHDGSTAGYVARLLILPATGQGLAIMTNGESEALLNEIQRAIAREYNWPVRPRLERTVVAVDPAGYAQLSGRYRVDLGTRAVDFDVSVEGTGSERQLLITGPSRRAARLLPLSDLHFFVQDTGNEFTFTREGKAVTSMLIDQQGQRFVARRVP